MPDTYGFVGDLSTSVGFFGIVGSVVVIVFAYRRYWNSPYRK